MPRLKTILYCPEKELPAWWDEAISSKAMLRLKDVGMNCGLEYTRFPLFQGIKSYSRYEHSLGVASIVWKFTHDPKQTLASLYHDIATPCFAHVIDFLNGDYLGQESTEDGTRPILEGSEEIQRILAKLGLKTKEVCDYHRYPVADTPSPSLSADRLEYTCSNAINLLREDPEEIQFVYDRVRLLEDGRLGFQDEAAALKLGRYSLCCGSVYCCDEDRYAMEILARILKRALSWNVLSRGDLMGEEDPLIGKLLQSPLREEWLRFRSMSRLCKSGAKPSEEWIQIDAKKRFIDPSVDGRPLTEINPVFREEVSNFLSKDFSVYLKAAD